jgi:hypothetical protein
LSIYGVLLLLLLYYIWVMIFHEEGPGRRGGTDIRSHHLLVYADVNLLGDNIDTVNKNTESLIDASKEDGLEISIQKTNICR